PHYRAVASQQLRERAFVLRHIAPRVTQGVINATREWRTEPADQEFSDRPLALGRHLARRKHLALGRHLARRKHLARSKGLACRRQPVCSNRIAGGSRIARAHSPPPPLAAAI